MVGGRGAWDSSSASTRDPSCDLCKTVAAVRSSGCFLRRQLATENVT